MCVCVCVCVCVYVCVCVMWFVHIGLKNTWLIGQVTHTCILYFVTSECFCIALCVLLDVCTNAYVYTFFLSPGWWLIRWPHTTKV